MILRPEEMAMAREYARTAPFECLTHEQMKKIMDRGRELHHWYKEHLAFHYILNLAVTALLLGGDYLILLHLPRVLLSEGAANPLGRVVLASLIAGGLHGWLIYSLSVFSMHEGAAHGIIFPGTGKISRPLNWFSQNMCRISAAEPRYYSEHHMSHHAKFGTEGDGEFLNFVLPRRYWLTFLPFASFLEYTDFIAHRPPNHTRGSVTSTIVSLSYHLFYSFFMARSFGWIYAVLCFVLFMPHIGFFFDRLRQFTEHNLMPLDNKDGSRSFGLGFWGMVIGGGPWGSPCHWEHHLVASIPWYQQLVLHRYLKTLLTGTQKKQFLLEPVIGYPKLLWRLLREPNRFVSTHPQAQGSAGGAD